MVVLLFCLGYFLSFSLPFVFSLLVAILLLVKEHSILSPFDPSRLDVAFFNMNGYISVVVCLGMVSSIFMG
jgi:4-hydroxybenzoate polyprenyltransferase